VPIPFTSRPGFALAGESVYISAGVEFTVSRYDNTGLRERFGVTRDPHPVSSADIAAFRSGLAEVYDSAKMLADVKARVGIN